MHRHLLLSALALSTLAIPAVGSAQTFTFRVPGPRSAPPAPRVVHHQAAPAQGVVWVEGCWTWQSNQWVWNEGYWVQDRPGYVVVQPQWVQRGGSWVLDQGGWAPAGSRHVSYRFDRSRRFQRANQRAFVDQQRRAQEQQRWQAEQHRRAIEQQRWQAEQNRRAAEAQHWAVQRQIEADRRAIRRQQRQMRRQHRRDMRRGRRAGRRVFAQPPVVRAAPPPAPRVRVRGRRVRGF